MKQPSFKFLAALLFGIALFTAPVVAVAQTVPDATAVRAAAVLTTADVYSTFTLPADGQGYTHIDAYIDFTLGALNTATVTAGGSKDDNPVSTGYYKDWETTATTFGASDRVLKRYPIATFGSGRYGAFAVKGAGTVGGSSMAISIRPYP
jgi:hypothetical protein